MIVETWFWKATDLQLLSCYTVGLIMDSLKTREYNRYSRTRVSLCIPWILLPFHNLVPRLPLVQVSHRVTALEGILSDYILLWSHKRLFSIFFFTCNCTPLWIDSNINKTICADTVLKFQSFKIYIKIIIDKIIYLIIRAVKQLIFSIAIYHILSIVNSRLIANYSQINRNFFGTFFPVLNVL